VGDLPSQDDLIEKFAQRVKQSTTRGSYRTSVRQLASWARERGVEHVAELDASLFPPYAEYLKDQGYSARTLSLKQGTIRRFFDFLVSGGVIAQTPVPDGWVPPQPTRATREPVLTMDQVESMLPHAKDNDARALIALGGLDGMKLGTIFQLTAGDVSFSGGRAVVSYRRSDGRPHALPVSAHSAAILRELVDDRPTGPLILPKQAPPNKRKVAGRRIDAAAKAARIPIHVNSRTLEKSFRAALLASGAPVHSVRERLGLTFSNPNYAETLLPAGTDRAAAELVAQAAHEIDALELLRQAETLCTQPGITPIAPIVIAGAALEMELRRLCELHGLGANKEGIDGYATVLFKKGHISRVVHSNLQANAALRNEAAHGRKSRDVSIPNAELMIRSVAYFIGGMSEDAP
jgi:site-specific recombinase XerD